MTDYTINFEPIGRRGRGKPDRSLLDCARRLGIDLTSLCSGRGTCHACKLRVIAGAVSPVTSGERAAFSPQELKAGWRLACQTYPASDLKIAIPAESTTTPQRTQVEGLEIAVPTEPAVSAYRVELPAPTLSDLRGDGERLLKALNRKHRLNCDTIDLSVLRQLSPRLREWGWRCQAAVRSGEVVALGPWPSPELGLAVDLGTTKVVGYLVDLGSGRTLASRGFMNPQISYGEDIISRLSHALESESQARELQRLAARAINRLATDLCAQVKASASEITDAVVVGNTAMHHLLLGLPVAQLARSPFVAAVSEAIDIKARELGLKTSPGAYIHLLPNIAGFVGADHTAMLLATEALKAEGVVLAIDIGTNTEVSLIDGGRISSVSCASGPAFEGGHIKDGMRAARGAIERLRIVGDALQYQTIGGATPAGLCGSGILDALAQLYVAGIVEQRGRLVAGHQRVRTLNGQREFVIISEEERGGKPAVTITQQDIRELQLAKAAIRSGIQVLLEANRRTDEEIGRVVIAGAFGSYIDVTSAITIGMLSALPLERFRQVGNAAGMGAKLALISRRKRAEAQALVSRTSYIELASAPQFRETFVQASYLGKYRLSNGERKEIS